jgi:hypothetical protein
MSARTALYAPAHRVAGRQPPGSSGVLPGLSPSVDFGGAALQDPRLPYNQTFGATGARALGWLPSALPKVCSQVPSAIATANIAALQHTTNGTPLTLVSTTGAGITVVPAGGAVAWPNAIGAGVIPAGALAIDGLPGVLRVNTKSDGVFYDPSTGISRGISITGIAGGSGGTFTVSGADWYGFPMTQLITVAAGANTVSSLKTFKFIYSVTPNFTDGTGTYSVGTADRYGFNLAVDYFADVDIYWGNAIQVASTFTPAVTTSPATNATGDVRGVFVPGSASNGTLRLDIYVSPSAARLTTSPMALGLFGVAQA